MFHTSPGLVAYQTLARCGVCIDKDGGHTGPTRRPLPFPCPPHAFGLQPRTAGPGAAISAPSNPSRRPVVLCGVVRLDRAGIAAASGVWGVSPRVLIGFYARAGSGEEAGMDWRKGPQDKRKLAEERCFTCKDGGDGLRVCDFE